MRILTLRFKNLNSLTGEWHIDFTHPDYQDTGIFAITGPTGAGKSTILDALCLALYGQTPRLGKISKSTNEIMSRQHGECFAEIEFTTIKGAYRCRWGQHRSRKKATGELQSPQHEIVNAENDTVIAHKIKDVLQTVEHVSGMNFDRFTRSMLLAQGGFAAFLQAKPDERAPLLEQITGTNIYSDISKKVHQRKTEEATTLAQLEASLKSIHLLSTDEKTAKEAELTAQKTTAQTLKSKKTTQQQAIQWHQTLIDLSNQLTTLTQQQKNYQQRYQQAQSQRIQLQNAIQAEQLVDDYRQLLTTRQQSELTLQEQQQNTSQLAQLDIDYQQQQQCLRQSEQKYKDHQATDQQLQQTLIKVRELDTRINTLTTQCKKEQQKQHDYNHKQKQLETEQTQLNTKKEKLKNNQRRNRKYLQQHPEDAALIEHLASLTLQLDQLQNRRKQTTTSQHALTVVTDKQANQTKTLATAQNQVTQSQALVSKYDQARQTLQTELSQQLDQQSITQWREHHIANEQEYNTWQTLETALNDAAQLTNDIQQLNDQQQLNQQHLETLTQQQKQQDAIVQTQTRLIDELSEKHSLQRTLQSLEQHRQLLVDNEACPLCGALEHPYHTGKPPKNNVTQQQLNKEKTTLKRQQKQQQKYLQQHSQTQEKTNQIKLRLSEKHTHLTKITISIKHDELPKNTAQQLIFCQQQQQQFVTKNLALAKKIKQVETLETKLQQQKEHYDRAKETLQQHQSSLQEQQHQQQILQQKILRLQDEYQQHCTKEKQLTKQLKSILQPYGITLQDDILNIQNTLKERQHCWKTADEKQRVLEKQQQTLEHEETQLTTQHISLQEQQQELTKTLGDSQQQLNTLTQQRHQCFGDKNPTQEAEKSKQTGDNIQHDYAVLRTRAAKIEQQQQTQQELQQQLKQRIIDTEQQQANAQTNFTKKLSNTPFNNEVNYLLACIPKPELQQLQQAENALNEEKIRLETLQKDLSQRYQQEQQRNITEQPLATLEQAVQQVTNELSIIERDIGRISEQLSIDQTLRQTQANQLTLVEAQKKEGERWNTLHQLIGSADGKKFRNFAQGLTFEIMIVYANQQLQKMSNRYLLIHNGKAPLELNIIDNYQAGEERSIKNLSGGESFIVSLALALGLSQMASNQISIDSLFLDEGFGTLDDETLETALEALAKLHQENKLIGVISHVAGLKERIPTQIHITPDHKGHSRLSGPGVNS